MITYSVRVLEIWKNLQNGLLRIKFINKKDIH